MGKIKGWKQDRNESEHITYWSYGHGLRRGHVDIRKVGQISARRNTYLWFVDIYKNKGYYEDAKKLGVKSFKTKAEALSYATNYMRRHPNG
jgi:hypothetical protein